MSDQTRYKIEVCCEGVVSTVRIRGRKRYLLEKAFLDELVGHPYPAHLPLRPIPDPHGDLYVLDRAQVAAYGAFRRRMRKVENSMSVSKVQAQLDRGGNSSIPSEFQSFCFSLAMGFSYADSTPQKMVQYAVNTLSREEKEAAVRFLDRVAEGNYDAENLQRVWDKVVADLGLVFEGDVRAFFLNIRLEMAKVFKPSHARRHSRR